MLAIEVDGCKALGFNTGLNARAFAQARFAQYITDPGLIVRPAGVPPGSVEFWKASGVREVAGADGMPVMVVWGPPIEGERLDALLNGCEQQDKAVAAVCAWIQAILELEKNPPAGYVSAPLWPCAAIVARENGNAAVFFAPVSLARRNVTLADESYVNPALSGTNAAAFTAAAMLYRVFAGSPPFSAADNSLLHQDMRDGHFLPVRFAVPGLNIQLAALIQTCLDPGRGNAPVNNGAVLLAELLAVLQTPTQTPIAPVASFVQPLSEAERLQLEKEKAQFLRIKTASVTARRFIARNTALLLGGLAAAAGLIFVAYSVISGRASLPTTAGMEPVQVIERYYHGFGELDHQIMEACVTGGAGKDDIRTVVNFYVINKTRQAYEFKTTPMVFPAHEWQGKNLGDTPLFGAADLRVELLGGDESGGEIRYRADYTFWVPAQAVDETGSEWEAEEGPISRSFRYSDLITLVRKKGNWRITEIIRD